MAEDRAPEGESGDEKSATGIAPDRSPLPSEDALDTTEAEADRTSAADEATTPSQGPLAPTPTASLDRKGRLLRALAITFTIYHFGGVLVGGAMPNVRRVFRPLYAFYGEGMKMTNSWGMFGRPPNTNNVIVEAEKADRTRVLLSTTRAPDRTLWERIRDVRIRKIQAKLTDNGDRGRFGMTFLDYYCREAKSALGPDVRSVRATEVVHELRDGDGKVTRTPSQKILLVRNCGDRKRPVILPKPLLPGWLPQGGPPSDDTPGGDN